MKLKVGEGHLPCKNEGDGSGEKADEQQGSADHFHRAADSGLREQGGLFARDVDAFIITALRGCRSRPVPFDKGLKERNTCVSWSS
jgi:hypothetical protein